MKIPRKYKVLKVGSMKYANVDDFSHFYIHIPTEWARSQNISNNDFLKIEIKSNNSFLVVKEDV